MAGHEGEPRHGDPTPHQRTPTEQHKPHQEGGNGSPGLPPTLHERAKPPPESEEAPPAQGGSESILVQPNQQADRHGEVNPRFLSALGEMDIQQIRERKNQVEWVHGQRIALIDHIGRGTVDVGEQTEKVGRVRAHVEDSAMSLRKKIQLLSYEEDAYNFAETFTEHLIRAKLQLARISSRHYRGEIPGEELERAKEEYNSFFGVYKDDPAIQRGVERRRRERETKEKKQ